MKPTTEQIDALRELINIGVGRGAGVLNTMLSSHIGLQVPFVKLLSHEELKSELESIGSDRLASVNLIFKGLFSGNANLIFPSESALKLVVALTGDRLDAIDLDSIRSGTLSEIGNIVLNSVMGTISNVLKLNLKYSVPSYMEGSVSALFDDLTMNSFPVILLARTRFIVEELNVEGDIVVFFEVGSFDNLLASLDGLKVD
jgi:chemotaxis protein CheC